MKGPSRIGSRRVGFYTFDTATAHEPRMIRNWWLSFHRWVDSWADCLPWWGHLLLWPPFAIVLMVEWATLFPADYGCRSL